MDLLIVIMVRVMAAVVVGSRFRCRTCCDPCVDIGVFGLMPGTRYILPSARVSERGLHTFLSMIMTVEPEGRSNRNRRREDQQEQGGRGGWSPLGLWYVQLGV